MQSNEHGYLPFPNISKLATKAHVFPDLKSAPLLSVGALCDANYRVIFDKEKMNVYLDSQTLKDQLQTFPSVMQGIRNPMDGLWDVKISIHENKIEPMMTDMPTHLVNIIIRKDIKPKSELIQYFQACCFSPTKQTFFQAVKNGNFITWPGLTATNVEKYYEPTIFTAKGHLNQER